MRIFDSLDAFVAALGGDIGVSPWMTVDQAMIDAFAEVSGDDQWIHVDPARCRRELGTGTIAHGYLLLSLLAGLARRTYRIEGISRAVNYGSDKVRFLSPVPAGSRVRARFHLAEAERDGARRKILNKAQLEIEGQEKPALIAEVLTVFYV
ncbi:MAG: MaoC family dehydratase [Hyphomicrobiales bacterium]|nr:MaoC family dehydratase [Hyphomicrobiales bacterium]